MKLTWQPIARRPYGEDHYNVPTAIGPVDAVIHPHCDGGWSWSLFGTTAQWVDAEGNQDVISGGRTSTRRESCAAIELALSAL